MSQVIQVNDLIVTQVEMKQMGTVREESFGQTTQLITIKS